MTTQDKDSVDQWILEWQKERPDLDPSPVGIQARIQRLSQHLLRQSEIWTAPLELSWEAFSVIVTLRRSGKPFELRPTDLLQQSLLTSGAITHRVDLVERMGLVERRLDPSDRRSFVIRLTPAGRKLADKAIAKHFETVDSLLGVLNSSERRLLAELLSKLLKSFEKTLSEGRAKPKTRRARNGSAEHTGSRQVS